MKTNRWPLLFGLALVAIIATAAWSAFLLHKEFQQLERATETLFASEHFQAESLQSRVSTIERETRDYLANKNPARLLAAKEAIANYRKIIQRDPALTAEIKSNLTSLDELLNTAATEPHSAAQLETTLLALEKSSLSLAQKIQEARTWQLVEMERSLDTLFTRNTIGGVLFLILIGWQLLSFYQKRIRPLRARLIEQDLQMQAQEKLMSLALLASGIAHEIRSPLAAIKARIFTLKRTVLGNTSATEDFSAISDEVARMEKIVKSFLQLARPAEPELELFSPSDLLADTVSSLRETYLKSGVQIELASIPACQTLADRDQIRQCLLNLLNNARDSIDQLGQIRIDAEITTIKTKDTNRPMLRIDIRDNGKGILPEQQKRLFDPFYTTKKTGTGLGLPLTQVLLSKQGARIAFQSEPGVGTVFSIYLPIDPSSTTQGPRP